MLFTLDSEAEDGVCTDTEAMPVLSCILELFGDTGGVVLVVANSCGCSFSVSVVNRFPLNLLLDLLVLTFTLALFPMFYKITFY